MQHVKISSSVDPTFPVEYLNLVAILATCLLKAADFLSRFVSVSVRKQKKCTNILILIQFEIPKMFGYLNDDDKLSTSQSIFGDLPRYF